MSKKKKKKKKKKKVRRKREKREKREKKKKKTSTVGGILSKKQSKYLFFKSFVEFTRHFFFNKSQLVFKNSQSSCFSQETPENVSILKKNYY